MSCSPSLKIFLTEVQKHAHILAPSLATMAINCAGLFNLDRNRLDRPFFDPLFIPLVITCDDASCGRVATLTIKSVQLVTCKTGPRELQLGLVRSSFSIYFSVKLLAVFGSEEEGHEQPKNPVINKT